MKKTFLALLVLFILMLAVPVLAKVGVGVGTGKIEVSEKLKAGSTTKIPSIVVINTGDETSFYEIQIDYRDNVPEIRPAKEWFVFEPQVFELDPGEQKVVNITLKLPVKGVEPGDYFAFVSASPVKILEEGRASINVAAASRLYFSVDYTNIFQALYYRFANFYSNYHPWNTIVLVVIFLVTFIMIFKNKFKIQIAKK